MNFGIILKVDKFFAKKLFIILGCIQLFIIDLCKVHVLVYEIKVVDGKLS